jgi:hypothetical protein
MTKKSKIVVIPQNPYNQNIAPAAGINDKLTPPKPVNTSDKVINALGEQRSASGPPKK